MGQKHFLCTFILSLAVLLHHKYKHSVSAYLGSVWNAHLQLAELHPHTSHLQSISASSYTKQTHTNIESSAGFPSKHFYVCSGTFNENSLMETAKNLWWKETHLHKYYKENKHESNKAIWLIRWLCYSQLLLGNMAEGSKYRCTDVEIKINF